MPQPSREQPQAEIAAGAEGEEPGGDRAAAGGAVAATLALGAGAYFRRRNSRLGFQGAITATAHKLARYVYAMLKHGAAYVSQSLEQLRGGHAGADRTYAPKESPCSGLRSGSQAAVKPSRIVNSW